MASIFFRLLKEEDKEAALRCCITDLCAGRDNDLTHTVRQETFGLLPGSPMPYWVSDAVRRKFKELPSFEPAGGQVQHGVSPKDSFQFIRAVWEVPAASIGRDKTWVSLAKGGDFAPYYDDLHLVIDWANDAENIRRYAAERYPYLDGKTDWIIHSESNYFELGLTYTRITVKGFNVRVLPAGCVFSDAGFSIFTGPGCTTEFALGLLNTRLFQLFLNMLTDSRKWEIGYVQPVPFASADVDQQRYVGRLARECHDLKHDLDRANETSHAFTRPALSGLRIADSEFRVENLEQRFLTWLAVQNAAEVRVIENSYQIDQAVLDLYEISERDRHTINRELGPHPGSYPHKDDWSNEDDERLRLLYSRERGDLEKIAHALQVHPASVATRRQTLGLYRPDDFAEALADFISYCIGCLFSRWDIRIGAGDREPPSLPDPEEGLPLYPPGALESDSPPLQPAGLLAQIIEHSARHGILVDDPGHKQDIVSGVEASLACLFGEERLPALRTEIEEALGRDLREWLARYFFPFHIKRYSKSRRKAPIYWQLTTSSKGYSLWLYYHTLGSDTLYTGVQEYVTPKIELEEGRLRELQGKCDQVKESSPAREARRLEKALEDQEVFLQELYTFRSELRRLADWGYDPDFDDGVIINIAPLQRLVPWKEAEKMWEKLEAGEYEWSTMAQHMKQHKQKDR